MVIRVVGAESTSLPGGIKIVPNDNFDAMRTLSIFAGNINQPIVDVLDILGIADQDGIVADLLDTDLEPRNQVERDAAMAGEFVKLSLPAMIPQNQLALGLKLGTNELLKLTPAATRFSGQAIKNTATLVRESLAKVIQSNPSLSNAFEAVSAVTAGIGTSEAESAGAGPAGQVAAGLAAGAAPAALASTVPKTSIGISKAVYNRFFSKSAVDQRIKKSIGKDIDRGLDEQAERNLRDSDQLMEDLGIDNKLTVAEASEAPALLAMQKELETSASGPTLNALVRRKLDITDDIADTQLKPEMTGKEPDMVIDAVNQRILIARRHLENQQTKTQQRKDEVDAKFADTDRVATGEQFREKALSLRKEVAGEFEAKADDIGLNDPDIMFPYTTFRGVVRGMFTKGKSRFRDLQMPAIAKRLLKDPQPTPEEQIPVKGFDRKDVISFEDLQIIRQEINLEMSEAVAQGKNKLVRSLTLLQKEFDTYFQNIDPVPLASRPDVAQRWAEFRNDYLKNFVERFDRGTAYKVRQKSRRGEYALQREKIADSFLASESTVQDWKRLFGNDPEAYQSLRAAVLDKARVAAVDDNGLNPNKLTNFIKRSRFLDELPSIKEELVNSGTAKRALSAREGQLRQRSLVIDNASLAKEIGGEPADMVARGVRNSRRARFLKRAAEKHGRQEALAGAVWQLAYRELGVAEGQLANPRSLEKWIARHETNLVEMVGRQHIENIKKVYKGISLVQQTDVPTGTAPNVGPIDKFQATTGTGPSQISSRIFAAQSGRVGYKYTLVDGALRFFNKIAKRKQNAILYQVLLDEGLARDLALAQKMPKVRPPLEKRLNAWIFSMGMAGDDSVFQQIAIPDAGPVTVETPGADQ